MMRLIITECCPSGIDAAFAEGVAVPIAVLARQHTALSTTPAAVLYDGNPENGWVGSGAATVRDAPPSQSGDAATVTHGPCVEIGDTGSRALFLLRRSPPMNVRPYDRLHFAVYGSGGAGQTLRVTAHITGRAAGDNRISSVPVKRWTEVTIPFSALGIDRTPRLGWVLFTVEAPRFPDLTIADIRFLKRGEPDPAATGAAGPVGPDARRRMPDR
jgi:hypothetical protein